MANLEEKAQQFWEDVFVSGPYSNLLQADYLVDKSKSSWNNVLSDPTILQSIKEGNLMADQTTSFIRTWWVAGRCTSFAIRIVRLLQEVSSPSFDFKFYDLKGHRVARCAKTGILIDSSSAKGILVLEDGGEWVTLEDGERSPKWKWSNGESKFKTSGQGLVCNLHPSRLWN